MFVLTKFDIEVKNISSARIHSYVTPVTQTNAVQVLVNDARLPPMHNILFIHSSAFTLCMHLRMGVGP